jgi:hypothetical protein
MYTLLEDLGLAIQRRSKPEATVLSPTPAP